MNRPEMPGAVPNVLKAKSIHQTKRRERNPQLGRHAGEAPELIQSGLCSVDASRLPPIVAESHDPTIEVGALGLPKSRGSDGPIPSSAG